MPEIIDDDYRAGRAAFGAREPPRLGLVARILAAAASGDAQDEARALSFALGLADAKREAMRGGDPRSL